MTTLDLERTPPDLEPPLRRSAARRRWAAHRVSIAVLTPLLVLAGLAQAFNMARFPAHIDDEGTYVAQAYAVQHYGQLSHYTYWYDHPPLGWIQLAGYSWATDLFSRYSSAVTAGREFMLVVQLVSCVLLWVLCRRLLMARWSSALAVALFAFSPLAIQFHRTVYLDNIATPWLIAAFALALTPQKRLSAFVGSALCFTVAVLTKETSLLLLPALGFILWRGTRHSGSRRYALTLASMAFVLGLATYALYALVKGELLPGAGHVSLWGGVKFQLFTRTASGNIFQDGSLSHAHLHEWLQLDSVFPVAALAATALGLFSSRMRPVALGFASLLLIMLKPGYLPVPYVIAMLPLAAVLVAGVADVAVTWRPARWKTDGAPRRRVAPLLAAVTVAALCFGVFAAMQWTGQFRAAFQSNPNAPVAQSEAWIEANVPRTDKLAVDDAYWLDLVRDGFPRDNVVWYYKIDTDPAVQALAPDGWRDYDYLVLTPSVRSDPEGLSSLTTAIANSVVVADFGTGDQEVVIRRTLPGGTSGVAAAQQADRTARLLAGTDLAQNPRLTASTTARALLRGGSVDSRVDATLAALSDLGAVRVTAFHADAAETAAGLPARSLTITGVASATVRGVIAAAPAGSVGVTVDAGTDGSLTVTWPLAPVPAAPAG